MASQRGREYGIGLPRKVASGMADVFVSYSRHDKARVAPLVAAIQARGWSVWWDPAIAPGQEFDRMIDAELAAASAVLVVWTPDSVASRWVRGEAREAADRGILVPVRFDAATLPIDARALQTIDIDPTRLDADSAPVGEMLQALGELVEHPGTEPVARHVAMAPDAPAPDRGHARIAICVLPFANMSGDPAQEVFSDGFTEDVITELSRWRMLAVRSRAASFRYRGPAVDIRQVARELQVRFVVEGSVRRIGERIRISAQVIDAGTGNHVWAEKFDRDAADIAGVQDEVVRTIVGTLVGRLQAADIERARRKAPANLAAYECVLQGNALPWDDPEGAAEATRLFERAIALDPGYGLAHALLAAMRYRAWYQDPDDADAGLQEAHALAKRAIELDASESTCFSILAMTSLYRRAYEHTLEYVRRSIALNPANQWNNADMGMYLLYLGDPAEALVWLGRAREIDPYFDEPWYWRTIAQAHMALGQYREALARLDRLAPRQYRVAAYKAACHARLGELDDARRFADECVALMPGFSIRHHMTREPYKVAEDAERLAASLRMAGLPE